MAQAEDIRIVMADDHLMFRQGLGRMLEAQDGISVAGECANGDDLLKLVEALDPDVAPFMADPFNSGSRSGEGIRHQRFRSSAM